MSRRREMTVRVVPLGSREAREARVQGTIAERLDLVGTLSARLWELSRQPLPRYTRDTIPIVVTELNAPSAHD